MAVLEMEEGRMQVCRDGAPIYDIVLEDSFDRLPEEMERLGSQGRKLCIVTDSNVAPLYLEAVERPPFRMLQPGDVLRSSRRRGA